METSSASSSANIMADIIRLIPPTERAAFRDMLAHETRGRVLVCTENLILIDYVTESPTPSPRVAGYFTFRQKYNSEAATPSLAYR